MNPNKMFKHLPTKTMTKHGAIIRPLTELERMASAQRGFIRRARRAARYAK